MLTLRTAGNFTLVRQIANHLDSDTNYVRAVIRNAYTDTILATLDLTDKGGQRFKADWKVPPDPSGEGFYISIVTSVYSDSGYTTKNQNYGDEENTYLVADRERNFGGGMAGGGVDSRTVRRIIQEEFAKIEESKVKAPEVEETPEQEEQEEPPRWDEVLSAINELKTALKPEKPEKVDFQPLFNALQSILSAVNEKEVTEPTDISPILEKLQDMGDTNEITRADLSKMVDELSTVVLKDVPQQIAEMIKTTTFGISLTPTTMQGQTVEPVKKKEEEQKPFDLSKISI